MSSISIKLKDQRSKLQSEQVSIQKIKIDTTYINQDSKKKNQKFGTKYQNQKLAEIVFSLTKTSPNQEEKPMAT